jgi:hypothetical protein
MTTPPYRRLWLAAVVTTLLALHGSMLVLATTARAYLTEQLTMKNADNASAIAISLSQQKPDAVSVELAVAALFDSGHYELIRVTDPRGRTIVERRSRTVETGTPQWFVDILPIDATPGVASISSGWKQFGTVTLVSHSRFAYRALWQGMIQLVLVMTLSGLVGAYLFTRALRRMRRPAGDAYGGAGAAR